MISALTLVPVVSVLGIYLARVVELGTKRNTVPGPVKENWTLRLFVLTGTLMLACSLAEFFLRQRSLYWPTFASGWTLAIVSFVVRRKAIAALGQFWSLHVEIRENHKFVQTGPFRWVRHPTYLSMVLEMGCVAVIANAWYSLLVVPFCFCPILWVRLHLEEAALVEKFGDAYRAYQKSTPALFPYKWPHYVEL